MEENGRRWGKMEGNEGEMEENRGKWGGRDGEMAGIAHGMWAVEGCGGML